MKWCSNKKNTEMAIKNTEMAIKNTEMGSSPVDRPLQFSQSF